MELMPEGTGSLFLNLSVCRNLSVTPSLSNMRDAEAWLTYIGRSSSKRLLTRQIKMQKLNHCQRKKNDECMIKTIEHITHFKRVQMQRKDI